MQSAALDSCAAWMRDPRRQVFYLAGYAGTGKTTLARHLVSGARRRWLFAAYTGKAAHVMRQKGCDDARTLHSLIYRPAGESRLEEIRLVSMKLEKLEETDVDERKRLEAILAELNSENRPRFERWEGSRLADTDVEGVVVDEVSMVDERLGRDLESFGKKILVCGDPAQLPPVGAGGYFTDREPDVMLTEIHRHARDSGILRLATLIREGGSVGMFASTPDCEVWKRDFHDEQERSMAALSADQVLVGRNATRRRVNGRFRHWLSLDETRPVVGDRLVCLRNDRSLGLFNGSQWKIDSVDADVDSMTAEMRVDSLEERGVSLYASVWLHHMAGRSDELESMGMKRRDFSEFDYAYAMTVHKSQGSQWEEVLLLDESRSFGPTARAWLYTGITRASKKLTVIQ